MPQQDQPLVSIIVPVYNAAAYLERSLGSILAQTYQNWECWVVDDGSTDGSAEQCDTWAQKDDRFKVIHKENGGVSSARNAALGQAVGCYLMFCDADDAQAPCVMGRAVNQLQAHPDAMVMWAFTREEQAFLAGTKQPPSVIEMQSDKVAWKTDLFHTLWNRIYDLPFIQQNGIRFDETLGSTKQVGEDLDFNMRYIGLRYQAKSFSIFRFENPWYFYFPDNPNSLMTNEGKAAARALPEPVADYPGKLLKEYHTTKPADFFALSLVEKQTFLCHYLRCLAFALWSAKQLGEALPQNFWWLDAMQDLLKESSQNKIYSAYYIPFKLRAKTLIVNMYQWDQAYHP